MGYQHHAAYQLGPQLPQGPVFHQDHHHHQQQQQQPDRPSSPDMPPSTGPGYRLSGVRTGSNEPDVNQPLQQQQQQQQLQPQQSGTLTSHPYPPTMPPPGIQSSAIPFYPYPPYGPQSHMPPRAEGGPTIGHYAQAPPAGAEQQHAAPLPPPPPQKTEGGPPPLPVIHTQGTFMVVNTSPASASTTISSALSVPSSSSTDARSPSDTDATSPGSAIGHPDGAGGIHYTTAGSSSVPRLPPILQVEKVQVTTTATQAASASRRRNEAHFVCPVPGCGSHLRSHTEERPYVCEWPGCGKCFARQHDCKRHQALHSQRTQANVCQGCKKTFSRLDALNRHLRSDGGLECRTAHQQQGGSIATSSTSGASAGGADNQTGAPAPPPVAAVANNTPPQVQG